MFLFLGEYGGRVSKEFQTIQSKIKNPTLEPEGSGTWPKLTILLQRHYGSLALPSLRAS
jgi:hypothetical protein